MVECTTTSAPSAIGCCSAGDANVLSTTTSTPASLPSSVSAAMSEIFISGFDGVSTQSTLVVPSSTAARTASRSLVSTVVWRMPQPPKTLRMSRCVPPYTSLPITTWSPGASTVRSSASSAARPDANERPRMPPSSAASWVSSAVRVGLPPREYS